MKTMSDYVHEVIEKYGVETQRELAELLGVTDAAISAHMKGRAINFSEARACKIAQLLGIDELEVLTCLAMERAKEPEVKKNWERARRKLGSVAAGAMFAVALIGSPTTSNAANSSVFSSNSGRLCIMSKRKRAA